MYMSFVAGVNGEGIGDIYPLPRNTYAALSLALLYFLGIPSEYKWDIPMYTARKRHITSVYFSSKLFLRVKNSNRPISLLRCWHNIL